MLMTKATDVPQQFNVGNVQKRSYQERLRCCSFVSDRLWRRTRDGLSARVEMSALARTSSAQSFYPCLKSCALHPDCAPVRRLMVQLVSLEMEKQRAGI